MTSQYKATCKCGASVDVPYSDKFNEWLKSHNECIKHPPKREWVWLTPDEITALKHNGKRYISSQDFARAVEGLSKEKNT